MEPARDGAGRVHGLHQSRARIVLEGRGIAQRVADTRHVAGGIIGICARMPQGVRHGRRGAARVVAEVEAIAIGIDARRQVANGIVFEVRDVAERIGDRLDAAKDRLVGERPAAAAAVDRRGRA